ncbi:MAG: ATP-dependent protease ATPase subunit HslU [Planctomycetes bacterium]|nr:ATP-dependent protease ATPase subunit HslU [Planctomycetota bacterium]
MRIEKSNSGVNTALTPKEIVSKLDEYIIGQQEAKRAVAIAIRNRWRRQQLEPTMREEVMPKNILMRGPTGVGKTEIARRLADLTNAPFIKVEASKYTEVGYHGRDVESMVRDLAKIGIANVQAQELEKVSDKAREAAEERILDMLLPSPDYVSDEEEARKSEERRARTREKLRDKLRNGGLNDRMIEISAQAAPPVAGVFGTMGGDDMAMEMQDMLSKMLPGKRKDRKVSVPEAMRIIQQEEAEKLIDDESINRKGIELVEQNGIIFIDEIDKVIGSDRSEGPDVSREGVQRDLLPIVEGSNVGTKYGMVKTDHILFIAAGAFHGTKPADLIPELQGRFPIRVDLEPLTKDDFEMILTHPKNALTKQYELLLGAEKVKVVYQRESLTLLAEITARVNKSTQDIGARRLHTIMERLFDEVSYDASEMSGQTVEVTPDMVRTRLKDISEDEDLSRFIL